jgi:hypothetical protein
MGIGMATRKVTITLDVDQFERARETGARVTVPAGALARAVRRPERQARRARQGVVTSDPDDLQRLDPMLPLVAL